MLKQWTVEGFITWFLQAVVIVGFPIDVSLGKGLVGVHTVCGRFDSRVL